MAKKYQDKLGLDGGALMKKWDKRGRVALTPMECYLSLLH